MSHNPETIGEEMLTRVMQYCDGTLSPAEAAVVAKEIAASPELQAIADDLRFGAAMARETMGSIAAQPVPLALARAIAEAPAAPGAKPANSPANSNVVPMFRRQIAAAVIGLIAGAGAMGFWSTSQQDAGLRLAGASVDTSGELMSSNSKAALAAALSARPQLVKTPFNLPGETGGQGVVSIVRWFDLSTATPCAEFTQSAPSGLASGIACQRSDGGWELMALPPEK